MNRPILIGILLFFIALATVVYFLKRKPVETEPAPVQTGVAPVEAPKNENQRRINIQLFFTNADSMMLVPEDRSVTYKEELHSQAIEVLKELMKGPEGDLLSPFPEGTHLDDLFITKEGTAYADFSQELSAGSKGGSQSEIITVYSIVDTLTLNFPQIKKVQILVNDQAVETLNGHLDLSQPLGQDLSMARMNAPPAPQTAQTQADE